MRVCVAKAMFDGTKRWSDRFTRSERTKIQAEYVTAREIELLPNDFQVRLVF
jgi:hypothetical protein